MIYVDASVAIAQLLSEERRPPPSVWEAGLVSSRLLEYETWTRINSRGLEGSHGEYAHQFLRLITLIELTPLVLARALEPFPVSVRTLDALHLSSMSHLRDQRVGVTVATYDKRLARAAEALGFPLYDLGV